VVRKPEGKRPLGRRRRRCEDNINMYRKAIGREGVDWIHVNQDIDRGGCYEHGNEHLD
jgi:hypothetical protein